MGDTVNETAGGVATVALGVTSHVTEPVAVEVTSSVTGTVPVGAGASASVAGTPR